MPIIRRSKQLIFITAQQSVKNHLFFVKYRLEIVNVYTRLLSGISLQISTKTAVKWGGVNQGGVKAKRMTMHNHINNNKPKTSFSKLKSTLGISSAIALLLTACATTPPPPIVQAPSPAPRPIAQAPVVPSTPPPITIAQRPTELRIHEALVRGAANHAQFLGSVSRASQTPIETPADLNAHMDELARVFSPSMGPALLSYGALIGAQESEFVEGVLETARYQGVDSVIYLLYTDPGFAAQFPGASQASASIQNAWASDIAAIGRAGQDIKRQSYSLQAKPKWKKRRADPRPERLSAIGRGKSLRYTAPRTIRTSIANTGSLRAYDVDAASKRQQFWRNFGRTSTPRSQTFLSQYNSEMHRKALTLSALEILGATGADSSTWIENYMTSTRLNQCLNTARLNTEQCVAAGHFKYEDAFCLAEHQLTEISNCLTVSVL